jgi:nicotinamidase-related amidase
MTVRDPHTTPNRAKCALLTIDVQADFTLSGAPAEIPGTAGAVPNMARLAEAFRAYTRPVLHMVRLYKEDGSNADLCRRAAISQGWPVARPGSPGSELVAELNPTATPLDPSTLLNGHPQSAGEHDWILYKPRWGAFYQTALDQMVSWLAIDTLVVVGCNFPNCPRTSIYEASERDLRVIVVEDALSGFNDQARGELDNIGVHVATTAECLAWLAGE